MASSYPSSLDSFDTIASDKKTSDSVGGRTHRDMHNDLGDAIEAVQGELGTDPAGAYATVKARFEAIEGTTLPQVDAKGDLLVGTADNTYDNLTAGSNDTVLMAASGETKGVKWAQIANANVSASAAIDRSKISGLPTSSTDNTLPRFDGTGGALQTSGIVVADTTNAMTGVASIADATMAAATVGSELGDGVSLTQALTGLTIGQSYLVTPVSGTLSAATLDGTSMSVATNATSFVATATSHTVVGVAGTATAVSVKLVTARSNTVAISVSGARVSQSGDSVFVGIIPLKAVSAGAGTNTAVGSQAMAKVVSGGNNSAFGAYAQNSLIAGYGNIAVGGSAQYSVVNGYENTAVGYAAQYAVTSGYYNTAIGSNAGRAFTTGYCNLALGRNTGYSGTTGTLAGTVCIGTNSSGVGAQATANNQIVLGTSSHDTLIAGSLEMTGAGTGIIVRSPDGTRYRLGVANGGAVSVGGPWWPPTVASRPSVTAGSSPSRTAAPARTAERSPATGVAAAAAFRSAHHRPGSRWAWVSWACSRGASEGVAQRDVNRPARAAEEPSAMGRPRAVHHHQRVGLGAVPELTLVAPAENLRARHSEADVHADGAHDGVVANAAAHAQLQVVEPEALLAARVPHVGESGQPEVLADGHAQLEVGLPQARAARFAVAQALREEATVAHGPAATKAMDVRPHAQRVVGADGVSEVLAAEDRPYAKAAREHDARRQRGIRADLGEDAEVAPVAR